MRMCVLHQIRLKQLSNTSPDHQPDRHLHLTIRRHVQLDLRTTPMGSTNDHRYIVTELMATDLNTILKAKKVEDQFAQYFMYQIMVCPGDQCCTCHV